MAWRSSDCRRRGPCHSDRRLREAFLSSFRLGGDAEPRAFVDSPSGADPGADEMAERIDGPERKPDAGPGSRFGRTSPGIITCVVRVKSSGPLRISGKTRLRQVWRASRNVGHGPVRAGRRNRLPHQTWLQFTEPKCRNSRRGLKSRPRKIKTLIVSKTPPIPSIKSETRPGSRSARPIGRGRILDIQEVV
jgi:hypothetical protein